MCVVVCLGVVYLVQPVLEVVLVDALSFWQIVVQTNVFGRLAMFGILDYIELSWDFSFLNAGRSVPTIVS